MDKEFWMKTFKDAPSDALLSFRPYHVKQDDFEIHNAKHLTKLLQSPKIDSPQENYHNLCMTDLHYIIACLAIVLQRYLGNEDVMIFVNLGQTYTLFPFRVDVQQYFDDHVAAVKKSLQDIHLHSNFPLLHLADIIWSLHGKSIESICVVELDFQEKKSNHDLICLPKHARMPLRMQINTNRMTGEMSLHFEWADGYVDDGIAGRFMHSFIVLCLLKPVKRIRDIDYLSNEETTLLNMFGNLCNITIEDKPIHSTFEDYASHDGKNVAVISNGECFTYKRINEMCNDIANTILAVVDVLEISEIPIVLLMKKDEVAVAAILAVWKIGGYFLPLSTLHDTALKDLLDSQPVSLIMHNVDMSEDLVHLLYAKDVKKLDMRKFPSLRNGEHTSKMQSFLSASMFSDVAYAIRTSGSTGRPKLCKITHKSLNILSKAWVNACNLCHGAVILQWAPLSFDVSIGDLVRALVSVRGTLVICPDDRRLDIPFIHSLINKHKVTNVEFTPQFASRVVENDNSRMLDSLKSLVLGSDVTHQNLFRNIRRTLRSDVQLANSYGMTEATIDSTYFNSKEILETRSGTVPIGKPLPGVGALILNPKSGLRCPIGTIGELYLYGDVIASGDVLCEEVMMDNHTTINALRTKDQCCWLPSGDIEFYGRLDDVVKIRGFRVSLTEIENMILSRVKSANEVCVLVIHDQTVNNDKNFLVAYVVPDTKDVVVDRNIIHKALEGELPYYMIPDLVCQMESIPMTLNGKVNRKNLPSLTKILHMSNCYNNIVETDENDRGCTELQKLFAKALGLDDYRKVSRTDTFMNQGGHSLVLLTFHGLILQKTSHEISIKDILQHPTIDMLDNYIHLG